MAKIKRVPSSTSPPTETSELTAKRGHRSGLAKRNWDTLADSDELQGWQSAFRTLYAQEEPTKLGSLEDGVDYSIQWDVSTDITWEDIYESTFTGEIKTSNEGFVIVRYTTPNGIREVEYPRDKMRGDIQLRSGDKVMAQLRLVLQNANTYMLTDKMKEIGTFFEAISKEMSKRTWPPATEKSKIPHNRKR